MCSSWKFKVTFIGQIDLNQLISLHLLKCWTGGMHESYLGVEFRIHLSRVHLLDLALGSFNPILIWCEKK